MTLFNNFSFMFIFGTCSWEYHNTPFWALNVVVPFLSMQGQKALRFNQNILICVLKMNKVWNDMRVIIDRIFIFGWTIPLNHRIQNYRPENRRVSYLAFVVQRPNLRHRGLVVGRAFTRNLSRQKGVLSRLWAHLQLHYKLVERFLPPNHLPALMDGMNLQQRRLQITSKKLTLWSKIAKFFMLVYLFLHIKYILTLQVSSLVHSFFLSGSITPQCLSKSHSFSEINKLV